MSHVGWIFNRQKATADYSTIQDFAQYPELRFLDRHPYFPAFLLAVGCFLVGGWPGLMVGFFLSTVILYHGVFAINSLAHVVGKQRYITGDDSRNNWWLAVITLGEGWHNNHHHYQSSTRQGFFWWEIDISYYVLKALSWTGLVWELRAPPEALVAGEQKVGRKVIEKVAREVAETFPAEVMARELRAAIERGTHGLEELGHRLARTRDEALAAFKDLHLPGIPTVEEVRRRIAERYLDSPTLDEIAERAREILFERILQHMGGELLPGQVGSCARHYHPQSAGKAQQDGQYQHDHALSMNLPRATPRPLQQVAHWPLLAVSTD
jgi:stearoyl-CoA desaturase (delta-9 desaturase)